MHTRFKRTKVCFLGVGDTLGSIFSFGAFLRAQGKLDEAEAELMEAVDGYTEVLGSTHPNTRNAEEWLAVVRSEKGK